MHVESFAVGPLGCTCSILADLETKRAIVVDPGGDLAEIQRRLTALGVTVDAIVHTHTHLDHVGETAGLQRATGAAAKIHESDRFLYNLLPVQSALLGIATPAVADVDGSLRDGTTVTAGGLELAVLHTPGHTPGSVCFVCSDGDTTRVFSGDTLFRRGIGRTDLWGGDHSKILSSLHGKLLTLSEDAIVIPGHGPTTTIGEERRLNPFLSGR